MLKDLWKIIKKLFKYGYYPIRINAAYIRFNDDSCILRYKAYDFTYVDLDIYYDDIYNDGDSK